MKTNIQKKSKNQIFIIWGLFISGVILVILIILLLAMKPQLKTDTQNQPTLTSKTNSQQEQETYNRLMNKIEKEIDSLTQQQQTPLLKYPKKTTHYPNGSILEIAEFNQDTGKKIKETEYDKDTGKIIKVVDFDENGKWSIVHRYHKDTGKLTRETFYNPDGTIKETKTY